MASAFDKLRAEADNSAAPDAVRRDLWAGKSAASIARDWEVTSALIRRRKAELFAPFDDPAAVKRAANGPLINAHAINRPRAARRASRVQRAIQTEMFPA